ncbi:hypothetical protein I6F14_10530 [Bradyrhizobium sp. IC3069]|uniref:hypothetical protein n=1 Tax=unclassified Bradyrhizobium TaxID=2631580 RepID=UPI001CD1F8B3|nr:MULTISPECIES: hypothetical protein [unclassified Bradyrhizobium]MCA1360781.1 hypothetical protein [Bradyrhizobium sp. IC4059]MCA1518421.1 hypothetical protein [Bradyrhizobium sp. IC3069]
MGLHVDDDLILVARWGSTAMGRRFIWPLSMARQRMRLPYKALLNKLVWRGLDPGICGLFIVDGAKAPERAIRQNFGSHTPIRGARFIRLAILSSACRNISMRQSERAAAGLANQLPGRAEHLIKNLAPRLELETPGASACILEGRDEIFTVMRLGLPLELGRSLA